METQVRMGPITAPAHLTGMVAATTKFNCCQEFSNRSLSFTIPTNLSTAQ